MIYFPFGFISNRPSSKFKMARGKKTRKVNIFPKHQALWSNNLWVHGGLVLYLHGESYRFHSDFSGYCVSILEVCFVLTLHIKGTYSEFFWSVFSRIQTKYRDLQSKSPHSIQIWKNTQQKTSNMNIFSWVLRWVTATLSYLINRNTVSLVMFMFTLFFLYCKGFFW